MKDLIAALCECHRRIERSLACLLRIAQESSGGALNDPKSFSEALWFFRTAVPEHSAAEEESVFPHARRAIAPGLGRQLDTLEQEHGCAERAHEEADRLGRLWLAQGRLSAAQTSRLAAVLEGLEKLYARHIRLEEGEVFPLMESRN